VTGVWVHLFMPLAKKWNPLLDTNEYAKHTNVNVKPAQMLLIRLTIQKEKIIL